MDIKDNIFVKTSSYYVYEMCSLDKPAWEFLRGNKENYLRITKGFTTKTAICPQLQGLMTIPCAINTNSAVNCYYAWK